MKYNASELLPKREETMSQDSRRAVRQLERDVIRQRLASRKHKKDAVLHLRIECPVTARIKAEIYPPHCIRARHRSSRRHHSAWNTEDAVGCVARLRLGSRPLSALDSGAKADEQIRKPQG